MEIKKVAELTQPLSVPFGSDSLKLKYRPWAIPYQESLENGRRRAETVQRIEDLATDQEVVGERRTQARRDGKDDDERAADAELKALKAESDRLNDELFMLYANTLIAQISEWDMCDAGEVQPIDAPTFRRFDLGVLVTIAASIEEDKGERNAGRSRNGSRQKGR